MLLTVSFDMIKSQLALITVSCYVKQKQINQFAAKQGALKLPQRKLKLHIESQTCPQMFQAHWQEAWRFIYLFLHQA